MAAPQEKGGKKPSPQQLHRVVICCKINVDNYEQLSVEIDGHYEKADLAKGVIEVQAAVYETLKNYGQTHPATRERIDAYRFRVLALPDPTITTPQSEPARPAEGSVSRTSNGSGADTANSNTQAERPAIAPPMQTEVLKDPARQPAGPQTEESAVRQPAGPSVPPKPITANGAKYRCEICTAEVTAKQKGISMLNKGGRTLCESCMGKA
ncbi:MAG: hypothetical protein WC683_05190 [bacterium]